VQEPKDYGINTAPAHKSLHLFRFLLAAMCRCDEGYIFIFSFLNFYVMRILSGSFSGWHHLHFRFSWYARFPQVHWYQHSGYYIIVLQHSSGRYMHICTFPSEFYVSFSDLPF
jgi:hypothetical protein